MNSLINEYRKQVPNDPRSDTELTLLLGEQNDVHGQYSGIADFVRDYEVAKAQKTLSVPPISAEFGRGFSRGVTSLKSSAYGAGALAADMVGADNLRQALIDRYVEAEQESAEQNPAGVARIEDVSGVGDAVRYGLGKVGELAPQLAEAALFGAAGAAVGTAAEPGVGTAAGGAAGVTTGLFARQAARSILKAGVDKLVKGEGRALVKDQLERIAKREVLDSMDPVVETLLKAQTRAMAQQMGQAGVQALNFYGQGAGAIYGQLANTEGVEDEDARTAAILGGIGSAIANAPLPVMVAKKFFPGVGQEVADKYVKRLLVDAAKEIPVGAGSEFADELIQIASEKYADPKRRGKPLSDDDLSRLLNAAVVGGLAGSVVAPFSAVPGPRRQEFDPALEQHFANVPEERRQQLAALKARLDTKTPSDADIAARRTLTAEEDAFFAVAEPTPSVEAPDAQAQPAAPVTEIPAVAEPTASASLEPEPVAVSPQLQAARQAAAAAIANEPDPLVAAVKSKVALAKEPETKGGDTSERQKEGQEEGVLTATAAVTTQPSAIAEQTGFTYDAKMETMVPNAWHFTDNRADSPTRGLSVAVKQGSSLQDVKSAVAKKVSEGYTAPKKGQNANKETPVSEAAPIGKVVEVVRETPGAASSSQASTSVESVQGIPRKIKSDDVDVENRGTYDTSSRGRTEAVTVEPAWFVPKTQNLDDLSKRLLTDATPAWSGRAGEGDAPRKSQTHRLTAILDKETGRVHVVSTFRNNAEVRVTKFGDDFKSQPRVKSRSLSGVLAAGRYEVIGSARSKEVTEYVHDEYPDVATFQRDFADPIERAQRAVQATASAQEATMAQAAAFRPEEEQADDREVIEEATGAEATVDYQEPPLADSINLVPAEVRLLAEELPAFEELDELSDFITGGQVTPELLAVIQKVARSDPHFFERVMADGLETVLKDYGYETTQGDEADAGTARPVEQSPVEPAALGIPATQLGGGERAGGPAPVVESVEDNAGKTEGEEPEGQEGTDGGDEELAASRGEITNEPRQTQTKAAAVPSGAATEQGILQDSILRQANPEIVGAPGGEVKFTQPEPSTVASQVNPAQVTLLRSIHEAAAAAGIDVQVVTGALGAGAYDPSNRLLLQVVGETVGRQDVKTAFHEVAHDVFANESADVRDRLLRAVDRLSDEALGVDLSADARIRASDPAGLGQQAVNEERLVDATAERLVQEGFNPAEATGFAQQFVRSLKDLYLRAALAVQRMLGFQENPELARRYFENRVKRLLAGDTSRSSYIDFVGAGKPSSGTRAALWFPSSKFTAERFDGYGALDYDHQPDVSMAASRFNTDRALRFNLPTTDPQYSRTVEIEKRAAVLNHQIDLINQAAASLLENKELRAEIGTAKPDEFFRELLSIADPALMKGQLADARNPDRSAVEFNPDKRIDGFQHKANSDAVLSQAYRNTQALLAKLGSMKVKAMESLDALTKRRADLQEDYKLAKERYTDWQYQTTRVVREMRKEANRLFRAIGGTSKRVGMIEQQLRALDPAAVLNDYAPAFQKLFTGDELKGERLFNLLDTLANDTAVDFTKSITEIRQAISGGGLSDVHPYQALTSKTKESNALLASVVAFAKTNEKIMAEIELRKEKSGETRAAIAKSIEALSASKAEFTGNLRELAKTAKLEERYRNAHLRALRDLRLANERLTKAQLRIKAVDQASPTIAAVQSELGAGLQLAAATVWRHEMPYNVPAKPTATSEEVVKAVKKLSLDSTGKVTNPGDVEADIQKMAEFMAERERRYNAGDLDAKDNVYQGVRRQWREIVENKNYNVRLGPAQRFMLEMSALPVGRLMADAFGTPAARMIDQMVNKFVDVVNEMRPEAERVGRRNDQLENELLKLMPGLDRDYLRANFLNPAKRTMQNQHDLEEVYAGEPERLKRAIYGRVREMLLSNNATRRHVSGVIDQFMPALSKLLEFQHQANRFLIERVTRAETGVLDPKLQTFNPATGKMEAGVRRHLQVGAYTFSQKLAPGFRAMVDALRNSDWNSMRDVAPTIADVYNEQGADAARALVSRFFNKAEYGDQVRNEFFRALAEMDNESPFEAPTLADGVSKPPADTMKVRKAFEQSKGEPVAFAEAMFALHDGTGSPAQYVQDTITRLGEVFHEVNGILKKNESDVTDSAAGITGMSPDALIDARSMEHLPGSWFDYHSFDQRDMFKMIERIAAQTAFGRGQERLASAFKTVGNEVVNAQNRLSVAETEIRRANPLAAPKDVEKALAVRFGEDYKRLRAQADRAGFIAQGVKGLSNYFRRDNSPDGTLNAMTRMSQTLGALLVNQPSSAIAQLAALMDINLKYGASGSVIGATTKAIGAAGKEIAASLAQAVGIQIFNGGEYHRRFVDLGLGDAAAVKKFRDAFDRLQGEGTATHFFRGVNDVLSTGLNPLGEQAEHTVLRPLQPFTTSAVAANKALTEGIWTLVGGHVMRGMEYLKSNPGKASDPAFKLDAAAMKLKGAAKDSFLRLSQDMERWGLNFDDMVRGAMGRSDKTLFTDQEAMRLYSMMLSEVSSESNISTMPLAAYNNSIIRFALPLLGWSFRRMQQIGGLRLNTEGRLEMQSLARGIAGLSVVAMGGLALNALIDEYYEELLGKKRNLRPVLGAQSGGDLALGVLENLNRVGTLGFFGELANTAVNVGGGGDNRVLSVDQRVVAMSAMQSILRATSAWIHQGDADYVHVVRPMAQSLGGGGLLQYMQIANNAFGFDNPEARVTARMNAQNYLRVIGRQLNKDVRTFSGAGGLSAPTPLSASLTRMELAAYANNQADFQQAYIQAVAQAKEAGNADPVDHVKRAYAGRNPLKQVFRTPPSESEYRQILGALPEDGRRDVSQAVNLFNTYAEIIGARPFEGKAEKKTSFLTPPSRPRYSASELRNRSVEALLSR